MELSAAIGARRMIRTYTDAPVEAATLDRLLDLARRAPSAGNTQATGFVVLDRPDLVDRYWDTTLPDGGPGSKRATFRWQGLLRAPVLILVTVDPDRYLSRYSEPDKAATGRGTSADRWPVPYWWVDVGAVIQNLLLLVADAGLGACLFGPFDHEPAIRAEFDLPDRLRIAATVAIGHPAHDEAGRSARRPRPAIDQLVIRPAAGDRPAG